MSIGFTDVGIWDSLTSLPGSSQLVSHLMYVMALYIGESLGTRLRCPGNETRMSLERD